MTKQELQAYPVRIFVEWCKGCGICVSFCPKDVLALSHHGKAYVANPQRCIQCGLCEQLCPDFAVSVKPREKAGGKSKAEAGNKAGEKAQAESGSQIEKTPTARTESAADADKE